MAKNADFGRPVIVYKKLGNKSFLAIPLSSQNKSGAWYVPFAFQNKNEVAALAQIRIISINRLYNRKGQIDEADFKKIKQGFHKLYF